MKRYIRYAVVVIAAAISAQFNCLAETVAVNQEETVISKEDDIRLFTSENKVWETIYHYYDLTSAVKYRAFRGTEEFNGKTYHRLCIVASANGMFVPDNSDSMESGKKYKLLIRDLKIYDEPTGDIFFRQEGSKVYMLDEKTELLEYLPKESNPALYEYEGDEHEMLVFDFNSNKDDGRNIVYNQNPETCLTLNVNEIITEIVEGVECKKQECKTTLKDIYTLSDAGYGHMITIIEGLGIVSGGEDADGTFYKYPLQPPCDCPNASCSLTNIYDSNGNVIFGKCETTTSIVDRVYSYAPVTLSYKNGVVNAESDGNEEISLRIYSADGSVVVSKTGNGNVEYPLTGLQKGVYIVRAVAGNSAGKTIRVAV